MVSRFRTDQSHGSRWGRRQFGETHQVVADDGHFRPHPVAGNPAVAQFPSATHRLHPAEDLFNPFPCPLADPVTIVASGASVDGRALLLGHMGRYLQVPAFS